MQWWCVARATPWEWSWTPYPGVWIFLLALVGVRAALQRHRNGEARGRGGEAAETSRPDPRRSRWYFAAGILALWAALDWPIGALGAGYLASAHMVQFLLIALVAPPLLLLGAPVEAICSLRPPRPVRAVAAVLTRPLVALVFFGVTMAWTHWPLVVDTWMSSQVGSFALDLAWLTAGLVFWWPVVAPRPLPWFGLPAKIGYLVVATIANTGLFMYLTYAQLPLYAIYELAPPVSWMTTRDDQVVAGILMKAGGGAVLWTAATILFARWYLESSDEDGRRREAPPSFDVTTGEDPGAERVSGRSGRAAGDGGR